MLPRKVWNCLYLDYIQGATKPLINVVSRLSVVWQIQRRLKTLQPPLVSQVMNRVVDRATDTLSVGSSKPIFDFHAPSGSDFWYREHDGFTIGGDGDRFYFESLFIVVLGTVAGRSLQ